MKKLLSLSLVASSLLLAGTDLQQLKEQMEKQQLIIEKLQTQIETIEPKQQTKSSKSYIPNISLITDFSYVSRNMKDDEVKHLEVPGVAHGLLGSHAHDGNSHTPYNGNNGFNFNYAELGMSSEVDPYLNMYATFHLTEYGFEIEEAYVTSAILGEGTKVKGGKFLSSFGYLNDKHHHVWSFADMPLVYEGFLGMHGINEIGLQVQWVAPTETYLMFGAEVLQGNNEQMFGNTSIASDDEENPVALSSSTPSLYVGYVKTSFDIEDTTVLAGLSYASGSSRIDHTDDEEDPHAFFGDSKLYGVDLLVKHYFDSYSYVSWQSEWLSRDMDGTQSAVDANKAVTGSANLEKKQSGYYTQLEYAVDSNWKTAIRYDNIYKNDVIKNGANIDQPTSLDKYSAMVEYKTSEFARFRLQYNKNNALFNEDGQRESIETIILQANFAIGAHQAHSF